VLKIKRKWEFKRAECRELYRSPEAFLMIMKCLLHLNSFLLNVQGRVIFQNYVSLYIYVTKYLGTSICQDVNRAGLYMTDPSNTVSVLDAPKSQLKGSYQALTSSLQPDTGGRITDYTKAV
jgi:hypothetical protein